jgi:uncharacterized protein with HEPN domain
MRRVAWRNLQSFLDLTRITDTRRIIAFRNRLIHGYAAVADSVVWGIVERTLPILRAEIDQLLQAP